MTGEEIKNYREKIGMSQIELAKASGLSKASISLLEKGDRNPSLNTAIKLSSGLGITLHTFAGIEPISEDAQGAQLVILKMKLQEIQDISKAL